MRKLVFKIIHSSYKAFSILLFFILFFIGKQIEGPSTVSCADGWDSPSIGRRGACSHHGGVVHHGTGIPSLLIALALSYVCYTQINSLFKDRYGYIVRSNLPEHELEKKIKDYTTMPIYNKIIKFKEARKPWSCKLCKSVISPGEMYGWKYAKRDSLNKEIRFCMSCVNKTNQEITINIALNEAQNKFTSESYITIAEYYRVNSIKKNN